MGEWAFSSYQLGSDRLGSSRKAAHNNRIGCTLGFRV